MYKEKSSFLKNAGVALPSLYYANKEEGAHWLVLEDVPLLLPKNRWEADSGVLKILFSLHFNTWKKELPLKSPFMPFWSNEMSTKALACFPKEIALEIKPLLEVVKERSRQIFHPLCWISGDPNPTNWGIRSTGKPVLFDWERAGYGHPAIDLAITIPGLGTSDGSLESLIAKRYLDMWRGANVEVPLTEQELIREINTAKIWSTVEFLANNSKLLDPQTLRAFVEQFPAKLKVSDKMTENNR